MTAPLTLGLVVALTGCATTGVTTRAELLLEWRARFVYEETITREPQPHWLLPEQHPTP